MGVSLDTSAVGDGLHRTISAMSTDEVVQLMRLLQIDPGDLPGALATFDSMRQAIYDQLASRSGSHQPWTTG